MEETIEQKLSVQDSQPPDLLRRHKTLFLVSVSWWQTWTRYVGYEEKVPSGPRPGPIDNSPLLTNKWTPDGWGETQLRPDLHEHEDFELVSPTSWRKLVNWYSGAPPIEVFLVEGKPDLQPIAIQVRVIETVSDYSKQPVRVLISPQISVQQVHKYLCESFALTYYKYSLRINDLSNPSKDATLQDLAVTSSTRFYIQMTSQLQPEFAITIPLPTTLSATARKSPSSHGDTQDDSDYDMDVLIAKETVREDRAEVQAKIRNKMTEGKIRLEVRDITQTEKSLQTMWLEFQHKDDLL